MQENFRPLEIAFMGWNLKLSVFLLGRFANDNSEQVAQRRREWLTLADGTTITALSPGRVRAGIDGRRFDQLIIADDRRELVRTEAAHEIEVIRYAAMCGSCVPEEYQVLYYNIDAPLPCRECGRPSEILHHSATEIGAVALCRVCHERAHAEAAGQSTAELSTALATAGKAFSKIGINADAAAEAFSKMGEIAKEAFPMERALAIIQANPSLSYFQKWKLIRKIKRRRP